MLMFAHVERVREVQKQPKKRPATAMTPTKAKPDNNNNDDNTNDSNQLLCVAWKHDGKAFTINDKDNLTKHLLPMFFQQESKFVSFTRKLYRWGFRRVNYLGFDTSVLPENRLAATSLDSSLETTNKGVSVASPLSREPQRTHTCQKEETSSQEGTEQIVFSHTLFNRKNRQAIQKMRSVTAEVTRKEEGFLQTQKLLVQRNMSLLKAHEANTQGLLIGTSPLVNTATPFPTAFDTIMEAAGPPVPATIPALLPPSQPSQDSRILHLLGVSPPRQPMSTLGSNALGALGSYVIRNATDTAPSTACLFQPAITDTDVLREAAFQQLRNDHGSTPAAVNSGTLHNGLNRLRSNVASSGVGQLLPPSLSGGFVHQQQQPLSPPQSPTHQHSIAIQELASLLSQPSVTPTSITNTFLEQIRHHHHQQQQQQQQQQQHRHETDAFDSVNSTHWLILDRIRQQQKQAEHRSQSLAVDGFGHSILEVLPIDGENSGSNKTITDLLSPPSLQQPVANSQPRRTIDLSLLELLLTQQRRQNQGNNRG